MRWVVHYKYFRRDGSLAEKGQLRTDEKRFKDKGVEHLCQILADQHGAGRLVIGYIEADTSVNINDIYKT
jgi:hypothetical protein